MPTFRTAGTGSLADSVRNLVSANPGMTVADEMAIDRSVAQTAHQQSLAEKVRLEADDLRRSAADRNDPEKQLTYAATASGITLPAARALHGYITGPEGSVRPEGITPEQERLFRSQLGSVYGSRQATGKTNFQQMSAGGGNLLVDAIRNEMTAPEIPIGRENQLGHAANIRAREPFKTTAQGTVLNEETGALNEDSDLAGAVRGTIAAQEAERRAAAGLSSTRAGDITATQPSRIELNTARAKSAREGRPAPQRTTAQESRDRAYASVADERAAAAAAARLSREQSAARQQYARDPKMKGSGTKLGRWVKDQGFEVLDKSGKHIGYYSAD